jgi:pyruvate dehydrogenase E1 component beta subunit
MTMLDAIHDALTIEMAREDRMVILGQDVGSAGGVFRATDGLQAKFGSDRVADTPLAEAAIVAASIGLAIAGFVPVAEIQFLGFTHQAFHQIGPQLARVRSRSFGRLTAPVTIRAPFGGHVRTPEHHGDALEAQFAQCPGLKIVMPATAADAKGLLLSSIRDPDPVLFCEPLRGYRLIKDDVPEGDFEVPLGKARIAREGGDVTLVGWSAAVVQCLEAAEQLSRDGIEATVVDLRSLVPLDEETLMTACAGTGRVVVVQEAPLCSGFAGEIVALVQQEVFYDLQAPLQRVAAWDTPYPPPALEHRYVPGVDRIVAAARRTIDAT